jgi:hypothetical protein
VSAGIDPHRWWGGRIRPAHVDWLVAAALAVDLVLESALGTGIPHRLVTAVFAGLLAAPVAVRRRWPAVAVVWAAAACLLEDRSVDSCSTCRAAAACSS